MTPAPAPPPVASSSPRQAALLATRAVAAQRWRIAALLTLGMVLVYFGFIALVAFQPARLGALVSDGLSVGIVLGACVIVSAWVLTWTYVSWANRVYDPALAALKSNPGSAGSAATEPTS
ncbi:DUF485 domain-containing protein [Gemmatimonas sp.]|uniref:DUF485 domain-containing protein n=1 Tax=Gemmatimonas sp. TaxID=1962908 RepID=UPI00391F1AF9